MARDLVQDGAEILIDLPMVRRGQRMLQAMANTAPAGSVVTDAYRGRRRVLMVYGAGHPPRLAAIRRHQERGGMVVMWDLGYWGRQDSMRLAISSMHPAGHQLSMAPAGQRWAFELREDVNPEGPVLLIGLGNKSAALYGLRWMQWENAALARIKAAHPGQQVMWRPKGKRAHLMPGTMLQHGMPIEDALRGCSLVVCRHSNAAVDACVAGVPVWCQDGAAAVLYASNPAPSQDQRAEFLRRLGWWNWAPSEAGQAWAWINNVISETKKGLT